MSATVLLTDIVDALQVQFDEMRSFLDLETGKVHTVSRDEMRAVEESDEGDQEEPGSEDDEESALLKRIVWLDESILELPDTIRGSGVFRYFKDTIRRHTVSRKTGINSAMKRCARSQSHGAKKMS